VAIWKGNIAVSIGRHVQNRLLSGLFVLIPVGISFFVFSLLYRVTVGVVSSIIDPFFPDFPNYLVSTIAVVSFLLYVYMLGTFASNVVGRRFISGIEGVLERMPLVNAVYGASKQVVDIFRSKPGTPTRSVALVPFPHSTTKCMAFVTSELVTPSGEHLVSVFIPTTPNPTTGFLQLFPADVVDRVDVDIDEAFRFIMSAGVIHPDSFGKKSEG
jgi:uncharacterized membrane protein